MPSYSLNSIINHQPYKYVVVSKYGQSYVSPRRKGESEILKDLDNNPLDKEKGKEKEPDKTVTKTNTKISKFPIKNGHQILQSPVDKSMRSVVAYYKEKAKQVHRTRRIFAMRGCYPTIRRELVLRGYVEKLQPGHYYFLEHLPDDVLAQHARNGNDYERVLLSKCLKSYPAYFVWHSQADIVPECRPYRNVVRNNGEFDFTSKAGLIACASQTHWNNQLGTLHCPRFHHLCKSFEDRKVFINDFRITQCQCLLRYVCEKFDSNGIRIFDADKGTVPFHILGFAYHKVRADLPDSLDVDSGSNTELQVKLELNDWKDFLTLSYQILNAKALFKAGFRQMDDFVKKASSLMKKLEKHDPTYKWDGFKNLWILKPARQSRGIGITIKNNLDDILKFSSDHIFHKYIVQKYIERPFLIYRTKFDIRQYMLLTINDEKLCLWLYKECYLKFSSTDFNLNDLNEQIHLTNNSVQKKYRNKLNRDHRLPHSNMWSLVQFKKFLTENGFNDKTWERKIFNGFKENLIALIMAGIEDIEIIPNSFDLYGCDFMLDESLQPILIEINSTPDMTPSTIVTASLCPKVLKDMLKVVIDLPHDINANCGQFELVFETKYKTGKLLLDNTNMTVIGKAIPINRTYCTKGKYSSIK